jgi:hypothetical protein
MDMLGVSLTAQHTDCLFCALLGTTRHTIARRGTQFLLCTLEPGAKLTLSIHLLALAASASFAAWLVLPAVLSPSSCSVSPSSNADMRFWTLAGRLLAILKDILVCAAMLLLLLLLLLLFRCCWCCSEYHKEYASDVESMQELMPQTWQLA